MDGDERLRLFFGLRPPPTTVDSFARWQQDAYGHATGVRPVSPGHLHVTLAFLGARPRSELPALREALAQTVVGCQRPVLEPVRYRETERAAMLVLDDRRGRAATLQRLLEEQLVALGAYRPERRSWLPHVTVARFRSRPRLRPSLSGLAEFSPSDAALYHSVLRPDGAQYHVVEAVVLGG